MSEPEWSCCQDDCPEPGSWGVRARIFTNGGRRLPGEVVFVRLLVCDRHKEELRPTDVLTDENWSKIVGCFHTNGLKADRESTRLFFEAVPVGVCIA